MSLFHLNAWRLPAVKNEAKTKVVSKHQFSAWFSGVPVLPFFHR